MSDLSKHFETLRFNMSDIKDTLLKALDEVRTFIIKHQLVIVGGMAIDMNLRLKNSKLYEDHSVPDYDMLSPTNAEHAYLLGQHLCKLGFPSVDVISAIHVTTMKVRVDGHVVADITYMPLEIFKILRVQIYQNLKVIHPWYTMMDQFTSLSQPYENAPREVITDRWAKDIKRLNLLYSFYPFERPDIKTVKTFTDTETAVVPGWSTHGILCGWAALAFLHHTFGVENPRVQTRWNETNFHSPDNKLTLLTTEIDKWHLPDKTKYFNTLISFPRHVEFSNIELYDFGNSQVTYSESTSVCSLPVLMWYFLHKWLFTDDPVAHMGVICTLDLFRHPKFSLDVTPYGTENWSQSTLYSILNIYDNDAARPLKPANQTFIQPDCKIVKTFDPSQSMLFSIDGSECKKIHSIVSGEILRLTC